MRLILFAVFATVFGFSPTGLVALSYAIAAASQSSRQRPGAWDRAHRRALHWCWISVAIGVAVEVPVVATLAVAALTH